jgi:hypothetical protein
MSKDVTGNPWIFDATTQGEGTAPNADSVSVTFICKPYIAQIKIVTGATGGDVQVDDRKTGGRAIAFVESMLANDTLWVPIDLRVKGVYIKTLPASAKVYVYHGRPERAL